MATHKSTTRVPKTRSRETTCEAGRVYRRADLDAILGKFADSRAVIETACKAMEADEHGSEAMTLRTGLKMIDCAYNALDKAIARRLCLVSNSSD